MTTRKIRHDNRGLYVSAYGWIIRPLNMTTKFDLEQPVELKGGDDPVRPAFGTLVQGRVREHWTIIRSETASDRARRARQ